MLAGHYGPALAMKARFPRVPLWSLFVAVQAVDIAFFIFAMLDRVIKRIKRLLKLLQRGFYRQVV